MYQSRFLSPCTTYHPSVKKSCHGASVGAYATFTGLPRSSMSGNLPPEILDLVLLHVAGFSDAVPWELQKDLARCVQVSRAWARAAGMFLSQSLSLCMPYRQCESSKHGQVSLHSYRRLLTFWRPQILTLGASLLSPCDDHRTADAGWTLCPSRMCSKTITRTTSPFPRST